MSKSLWCAEHIFTRFTPGSLQWMQMPLIKCHGGASQKRQHAAGLCCLGLSACSCEHQIEERRVHRDVTRHYMIICDIQQPGILSGLISYTCFQSARAYNCFIIWFKLRTKQERIFQKRFHVDAIQETSQQQSLLGQNTFAMRRRVCGIENV